MFANQNLKMAVIPTPISHQPLLVTQTHLTSGSSLTAIFKKQSLRPHRQNSANQPCSPPTRHQVYNLAFPLTILSFFSFSP